MQLYPLLCVFVCVCARIPQATAFYTWNPPERVEKRWIYTNGATRLAFYPGTNTLVAFGCWCACLCVWLVQQVPRRFFSSTAPSCPKTGMQHFSFSVSFCTFLNFILISFYYILAARLPLFSGGPPFLVLRFGFLLLWVWSLCATLGLLAFHSPKTGSTFKFFTWLRRGFSRKFFDPTPLSFAVECVKSSSWGQRFECQPRLLIF